MFSSTPGTSSKVGGLRAACAASLLIAFVSVACAATGEIAAHLTADPEALALSLDATLEVAWSLGGWSIEIDSEIDDGTWDALSAKVSWDSASLEISSRLRHEPHKTRWKDWRTNVAFTTGAIRLEVEHKLTRTRRWIILEGDSTLEGVSASARFRFRASPCDPVAYYDATFELASTLCGIDATWAIDVAADGFEQMTLELDSLRLLAFGALVTDLDIVRTAEGASILVEPSIKLDATCVRLDVECGCGEAPTPLRIVRIELAGSFASVELSGEAAFGPDAWIDDEYAAEIRLEVETRSAGGLESTLETRIHWIEDPLSGLALAHTSLSFDRELAERVEGHVLLDIRTAEPRIEIIAGLNVSW